MSLWDLHNLQGFLPDLSDIRMYARARNYNLIVTICSPTACKIYRLASYVPLIGQVCIRKYLIYCDQIVKRNAFCLVVKLKQKHDIEVCTYSSTSPNITICYNVSSYMQIILKN